MSPWIAAHAASFIGSGIGKSGNPCARFIAPYWLETRVISRMSDSVNVEARMALRARAEAVVVIEIEVPLVPHLLPNEQKQKENEERRRDCSERFHRGLPSALELVTLNTN